MKDVKTLLNRKDGDEERSGYGEESMEQLWEKAFAKAKGDLKFDPAEEAQLADFQAASDPLAQTEALFRDWRHPQDREFGNKLREPVQQCMSWAQKACTYVEGHASGTVCIWLLEKISLKCLTKLVCRTSQAARWGHIVFAQGIPSTTSFAPSHQPNFDQNNSSQVGCPRCERRPEHCSGNVSDNHCCNARNRYFR